MISNELLNNISHIVVVAKRKGNTFVVTDELKGGNEEFSSSSNTELLDNNDSSTETFVVADRKGNTIVVTDVSVSNRNTTEGCNNSNNDEEDINDCNNTVTTTLSTIVSAVKSLSLSSSSKNQLTPEQPHTKQHRRRIAISTLMTGRRGRKLLYLFKIKSKNNSEKNVTKDDLDLLLFEKKKRNCAEQPPNRLHDSCNSVTLHDSLHDSFVTL
jgi:hypothetical protein